MDVRTDLGEINPSLDALGLHQIRILDIVAPEIELELLLPDDTTDHLA